MRLPARKSNIALGKTPVNKVFSCLILLLFISIPFIANAQDGGEISANTCASVNSEFNVTSVIDADFGGDPGEIDYKWIITYKSESGNTVSLTFSTNSVPNFKWDKVIAQTSFTIIREAWNLSDDLQPPSYSNELTININPRINLLTNPVRTCTNLTSFLLGYTHNGIPTIADQYSIEWSAQALAAGFTNVNETSLDPSGENLSVQLPVTVVASEFSGSLMLREMATGCVSNSSFSVVVFDPPSLEVQNPEAVCSPATVNLAVQSVRKGPIGTSYTYWTDNTATTSLSGYTAVDMSGTYYIRGKSSPGTGNCLSIPYPVVVTVKTTPIAPTTNNGGPVCAGADLSLTASDVTGGSYSWQGPNGFLSSNQNPVINAVQTVASGIYSVTVTVNGCTSVSGNTDAIVHAIPSIPIVGNGGAVCEGTDLSLTASDVTGGIYSWQGPNGFLSGNQNPLITAAQTTASGTYSVTVTVNGCTSSEASTNAIVHGVPLAPTAGNGSPVCEGASLNLTASNVTGGSYSWLGPNGYNTSDQSPVINAVQTAANGTYSVTVTVNGCTSATATTLVVINALPPAPLISGTLSFCSGQSTTLTSDATSNIVWSTGETVTSITVNNAGTYSVTVTDGNGCSNTSAVTDVTMNVLPAAPQITGATSFCTGQSTTLSSNASGSLVWSTGETIPSITVANGGTYSVTVTDGNGCSNTSSVTDVIMNLLPAAPQINGVTSFCAGQSTTLSSNASGSLVWSTGETVPSITITNGGTYSVTVTDGNGCSNTSAVTDVTMNMLPAAPQINGVTSFCAGQSTTLSSNASGSLVWSTGETVPSITVTNGGTYSVTITDGNGCSNTSSVTDVTMNALPTAPQISGTTSFCAGQSTTLSSNASGSLVWSTGETVPSITITNGGTYSVTVTDVNGCSNTSAATDVIMNMLPAAPQITGATSFCAGQSTTLSSNVSGSLVWSTGETVPSITVTNGGTYSVTVTDGNGCSSTSVVTDVTENTLPAVPQITGATSFCTGQSTTLVSNESNGIVWSTGETIPSIIVANTGTYSVTITDGNGCSNTSAVTDVTMNALPTAPQITGATSFCTGQSTTLSSNASGGLVWSTGETVPSITVTNGGTYSVTVTDGNGCSSTSVVTDVTENTLPAVPQITGATSFCTGQSTTLTSNESNGIVWSTGETIPSIIVANAGTYSVTVTDGNGCSNTSAVTDVTMNVLPAAPQITGATSFCTGQSTTLSSNASGSLVWSTGETIPSITVANGGTYSVTVTDGNGCSNTSSVTDVIMNLLPAAPQINGVTSFCAGQSTTLSSNASGSLVWSTGETVPSITITNGGTYSVTVTDGNGCSNTSAVTDVTMNALPTAPQISGTTSFCAGQSTTLSSNASGSLVWSTGETVPSITITNGGTYSVTVTDGNGCSNTSVVTDVTMNALPTAPQINGVTSFCAGQSTILTSNVSNGIVWSTGETVQSITITNGGTYSVTVTDGNGCSNTSVVTDVTMNALPAIPQITGATSFCIGQSTTLSSNASGSLVWSTGETVPSITVTNGGSYSVTVTDGNGCSSTSIVTDVTENTLPAAPQITGATSFCTGQSTTLSSNASGSLIWSTGETVPSIIVANAGTYSVTVTDGNGCSNTSAVTDVTMNALPAAPQISGTTSFCAGQSTTLSSNASGSLVWSTGETVPSITVTNDGTYSVTITDGNGCLNTSAVTDVTMNALPTAPQITGATSFCTGQSTTLSSNASGSLVWSTGETIPSITVANGGTYSVTVTDGNGCSNTSSVTDVIMNLLPAAPQINGVTSFCAGQSTTLSSNASGSLVWSTGETVPSITITNGGTYSVTVTDGNGCSNTSAVTDVTMNMLPAAPQISGTISFCAGQSTTLSSNASGSLVWSTGETVPSITITNGGTYSVTVTDGNGCSNTSAVTDVTMNALPAVPQITGATSFCTGQSTTLSSNASGSLIWSTGETVPSITVTNGGTYSVTVTDGNGCSSTSVVTDVTENTLPAVPQITGATSFCTGQSTTLSSNASGSLVWSTGETVPLITITNGGTYSVTVTDVNGCYSTSVVTDVTENTLPAVPQITGATSFCTGQSTTLTSNESNGIVWSTGETVPSIVITNGGTYTVTVTDGNGCSNTSAVTDVTMNALPTAPQITGVTSFCTGQSTTLSSNASGSLVWSTGETVPAITVINGGTYTVTVTDGNGCSNTSAVTDVIMNMFPAAPQITGATSFCAGQSTTLSSNVSGSLVWSTGETVPLITITNGGTYSVTVTDGNGCSNTSAVTDVIMYMLPAAPQITGATSFCAGQSTTLSSNVSGSLIWSTGETVPSITVTNGGTYSVTVTDGNGCSNTSALKDVIEHTLPAMPQITGATSFCTGQSTTLVSNVSNGIVWNTGEKNPAINVTQGGMYSVTVTDGNGCSNTSAVIAVMMNPLPSLPVINGPSSFCAGKPVVLLSTVANAYLWNTGDTTRSITVAEEGNYSVTIADINGCVSVSQNIKVTVNPSPTVRVNNPPAVCAPLFIDLTNNIIIDENATNLVYTYWKDEATTEPLPNPTAVRESGIYYVKGTIASTGCSNVRMVPVNVYAVPAFTINNPRPVCEPATINLTDASVINAKSSGLEYSFWSDAANTVPLQNPTAIKSGGIFYVKALAPTGCSVSLPVSAEILPLPSGTLYIPAVQFICEGSAVELRAESNADRFQWYKNNMPIENANSAIYPAASAGNYSVAFISRTGCMRKVEKNINLDFIRKPELVFKTMNNCEGKEVQFTNLSSVASSGNISWLWDFGNGASSTSFSASSIYKQRGIYSVSLKAINATCPSLTVAKGFSVTIEAPRAGMRYTTIHAVAGTEFRLSARNFGYRYQWQPPHGLNNASIANPSGKLQKDTMYTVQITSAAGCETVDTVSVRIRLLGEIHLPDAFTPNSDGQNDLLYPNLVAIQTLKYLRIYNRWGKLVFQTNHASPKTGWDGRKNGIMQPGGAYVWIAEGIDYGGNVIRKNGTVLLLQ